MANTVCEQSTVYTHKNHISRLYYVQKKESLGVKVLMEENGKTVKSLSGECKFRN